MSGVHVRKVSAPDSSEDRSRQSLRLMGVNHVGAETVEGPHRREMYFRHPLVAQVPGALSNDVGVVRERRERRQSHVLDVAELRCRRSAEDDHVVALRQRRRHQRRIRLGTAVTGGRKSVRDNGDTQWVQQSSLVAVPGLVVVAERH